MGGREMGGDVQFGTVLQYCNLVIPHRLWPRLAGSKAGSSDIDAPVERYSSTLLMPEPSLIVLIIELSESPVTTSTLFLAIVPTLIVALICAVPHHYCSFLTCVILSRLGAYPAHPHRMILLSRCDLW